MLTMSVGPKRDRLIMLALAVGLALGAGELVRAQDSLVTLTDLNKLPDLVVSIDPTNTSGTVFIPTGGTIRATIRLDNRPPATGFWRFGMGNNVGMKIRLTNLKVVSITYAGNLSCSAFGGWFPDYQGAICSGSILWGQSAAIVLELQGTTGFCDGRNGYLDATGWISPSDAPEPSKTNNTSIVRTLAPC